VNWLHGDAFLRQNANHGVCLGHKAIQCKSKRTDIFPASLPWNSPDIAWEKMIEADTEKDMDAFKTAFFSYAKALMKFTSDDGSMSGVDVADMEKGFRAQNRNMHLIAKVSLPTYLISLITTLTFHRSVRFPVP
jgi:hypothetical protein